MKQKYFLLALLFILPFIAFSQTVVDDFTDGNFTSNQTWSGSTTGFSVITDATLPNGSASTDGSYLASNASHGDISLAISSTEVSEWRFSLGSPDFNPSGSNYIGVVLMASAAFSGDLINDNVTNNFQGYYLRIGDSGSDPIELWRKTGTGETIVGDFPSSPSFSTGALQNGLNIRVTRSSSGVFELFYSVGFQYDSLPMTSAGTVTNNTYSTSSYFGVFQNIGSTSTSRRVYIDNIQLGVVTWDGSESSDWGTAANWDTNSTPTTTDNIIIPNSLTEYPTASSAVTVNSVIINSGASLIAQSTFSGTVSYSRTLTTNWHLLSSPVGSQDINTFTVTDVASNAIATSGTNYGVAPYDNNGSAWVYYTTGTIGAAGNFVAGKGYSALRTSAGDVTFTGSMPTDNVSIAITDGTANEWNLIGNPYPSYIPANSGADATNNFITINTADLNASYQAVYFWNGTSYVAINHASGSRFIAPGQGFFVNSIASGSTVDFTEAMQSHQTTDVFSKTKSSSGWPEINLMMTDGVTNKTTDIKYITGTTTGLDPGYDAGMFSGTSNAFSVYTHLVTDSEGIDFTLQALPDNDYENISVPIGFNSVSGKELTFTVNHANLPNDLMIFLEDKVENKIVRLDETDTNYKINLNADNNGIGRFYIRTSTTDLRKTLGTDDITSKNISIYFTSRQNLRIAGLNSSNTQITMYNILGKRVLHQKVNTVGVTDVSMPVNLKQGIYIIKIDSKEGSINKKVFLK
jgi:hypothetical protein